MSDEIVVVMTSREGEVTKVFRPGDLVVFLDSLQGNPTPEEVMYCEPSVEEVILQVWEDMDIEVVEPRVSRQLIGVFSGSAGGELESCYLMHLGVSQKSEEYFLRSETLTGRWTRGAEARYCCPSCMSLGLDASPVDHCEVVAGTLLVCQFCKAHIWTAQKGVIITPDPSSEGETWPATPY